MSEPIEELRAWCKTESRELPIDEICESIEAYDNLRSCCTNLMRENDRLRQERDELADSGKAILARLEEARRLLSEANILEATGGWSDKVDAWLKEGK